MKKKRIPEYFYEKTIIKELNKIRKEKTKASGEYLEYLIDYEMDIKRYSVNLIEKIKEKNEFAFNELIELKDMRNFIHYYANHINKHHRFKFDEDTILHEIKFQIYYHVLKNYRIYDEPHEISLLINSMRRWLKLKVNDSLKITFMPKNDERLNQSFLESECEMSSDFVVNDLVNRYLDDEEKRVFELRFFHNLGYVEIGKEMGFSKDTAQRRYNRCLDKLKEYL